MKVNEFLLSRYDKKHHAIRVRRPWGSQEVSTSTEVEKKLTFTLDAGQTRYVRTVIGIGFFVGRVYPELVDDATGQKELEDASYIGQPLGQGMQSGARRYEVAAARNQVALHSGRVMPLPFFRPNLRTAGSRHGVLERSSEVR
jgi:hypothetical protein